MKNFTLLFSSCLLVSVGLLASYSSPQEGYGAVMHAYQQKEWNLLLQECEDFCRDFEDSDFLGDVHYYQGIAYFEVGDYDLANRRFSSYLQNYASEKFFEEAFAYKFLIAKKFESGKRLHMFGLKSLPKVSWAGEEALHIYDEIIKTLPRHDLAAQALYRKGGMLAKDAKHKEAIEVFQTLIRRFPKHSLTSDSYLQIAKIFARQAKTRFTDMDLLDLSEMNLRGFIQAFPQDPRIAEVQSLLLSIKESYAEDLWETARFFERQKEPIAAILYYKKLIQQFPETDCANKVRERLEELKGKYARSEEIQALVKEIVL